jgi:alkylation response protein AidB-like acyl-CoA dehydrogenase
MDLRFTAEEIAFREKARHWLDANVPRGPRPVEGPELLAYDKAWQRRQFDAGWAGISWPAEYGGKGLTIMSQLIWHEEYARAGGPPPRTCLIGMSHAGPTIMARGNDAQKREHLPRILSGERTWCQGFSEPDAGSDLANIRTRGMVKDDHISVTGQKIWTSHGQLAEFQELLVRTDPDAAKHKGLTWLICDMKSPGMTIRPLRTLAGRIQFCQVFYDDVRIPLSNVVGAINDGWSVAMSTLSFERGVTFIGEQIELSRTLEELTAYAETMPGPDGQGRAIDDAGIMMELATLRSEMAALRAMNYLNISRIARDGRPAPESSMPRLVGSELMQRMYRLAMDISGVDGLDVSSLFGWPAGYLQSISSTIYAGTSEIQRNIIGERVLGLPRGK